MLNTAAYLKIANKALLVVVLLMLTACGGKGNHGLSLEPGQPAGTQLLSIQEISLDEALDDIQASPPPAQVDPAVWEKLTGELASVLSARGGTKIVSAAPSGEHNRVTDLTLVDDGAGGFTLDWTYVNVGDFDQNGEVNIADLTPIGLYFGAVTGDANWDDAQLADGDSNGEVNISDVTPIGMNFLAQVAGYNVNGAQIPEGFWTTIETVEFSDGAKSVTLIPGNRLRYSSIITGEDYQYFQVAPVDSTEAKGSPSNVIDTLSPLITSLFTLTPDATFVDTPTEVVFNVGLDASVGVPVTAEVIEVNEFGIEAAVLGSLVDNGDPATGDETADDRLFSFKINLASASESSSYYRAKVTYDPGDGVRLLLSNIAIISFFAELTASRFQEINDQIISVAEQIEALLDTMTVPEACAQVAETLASDPNFTEVVIGNEGYSVNWTTPDGYPCFSLFPPDEDYSGTSASSLNPYSPPASSPPAVEPISMSDLSLRTAQADGDDDKPVGNRRVLILDPRNKTNGTVANLFENWQKPKYDVDYFNAPDACSLDVFKTMNDYGIIIIVSEGIYGITAETTSKAYGLATNHLSTGADHEKWDVDWAKDFISAGTIGRRGTAGFKPVWAIRPGFITKHCQKMPGSLVFVMSDHSLKDETWANAFFQVGAKAYYGMSGIYSKTWAPVLPTEHFTDMLNGKNSKDAYEADGHYRIDPKYINNSLGLRGGGYAGVGNPISITKGLYEVIVLDKNVDEGSTWNGDDSIAHDLNNKGQVVGTATITTPAGGRIHAFRWDPGEDKWDPSEGATMHDLHTFGDNPPSSRGTVISDSGDVAGYSGDGFPALWLAYDNGGTPGPMAWIDEGDIGYPTDMSNGGIIVGETGIRALGQKRHAMVYSGGEELTDLGMLDNDSDKGARATVINEHGLIAGYSRDALSKKIGFYYTIQGNQMLELPRPNGADGAEITSWRGQFTIYGYTINGNSTEACYWHVLPEGVTHHKWPNSFGHSGIVGANGKGDIIGYTQDETLQLWGLDVIWRNGKDYMEDIANLLDPNLDPAIQSIGLKGINNAGQILVNAEINGEAHGVLLNPRIPLE